MDLQFSICIKKIFSKIYSKDVNRHFINLQKKIIKPLNYEALKPGGNTIKEKTKSIDWSSLMLYCIVCQVKKMQKLILEMVR